MWVDSWQHIQEIKPRLSSKLGHPELVIAAGWLAIWSVVLKDALICQEKWEVMEELSNPWLLIGDVSSLTNSFMRCVMLQVVKCTVNVTTVHEYIKNFKDLATVIKSFLLCFDSFWSSEFLGRFCFVIVIHPFIYFLLCEQHKGTTAWFNCKTPWCRMISKWTSYPLVRG